MKAFLAALAVMIVITAAAPYALNALGLSAAEVGVGSAVRLD